MLLFEALQVRVQNHKDRLVAVDIECRAERVNSFMHNIKNDRTYFKNLTNAKFLKYVWPFFNIVYSG